MQKIKVKKLESLKEKTLGLIGAKEAYPVYFKTRFGIHTFALNFSIDVLVLDSKLNVVKISKELKPRRILLWNPYYNNVLELPLGSIQRLKIKKGDHIIPIF